MTSAVNIGLNRKKIALSVPQFKHLTFETVLFTTLFFPCLQYTMLGNHHFGKTVNRILEWKDEM
jgi:hypothetical protein